MALTVSDLRGIASVGGGMVLNAKSLTASDLRGIASAAKSKKAQITIRNFHHLTASDMRGIASAGDGCVVFDFTA